jgi:hypothetical protein
VDADRIDWPNILAAARKIIEGYDTGVTLRQLFYRLVAAELLPNKQGAYSTLSSRTAEARRAGNFPDLIDRTRTIHRYQTFENVTAARSWLAGIYRRDRTEGQSHSVYLAVEKHGIVEQLRAWYGDLGFPILALGGYASQTYADDVKADVTEQDRGAVLIYAGDYDPSGMDIQRDFVERVGCFDEVIRVALDGSQVKRYRLPPQPGKATDTRAASFVRTHGKLVQVELDALPPNVLKDLYTDAIAPYLDMSTYRKVLRREKKERTSLRA